MQAVYLLQVASQTLLLVTHELSEEFEDASSILYARFSFDGKLVVVISSLGRGFHVYSRQGQKLSHFEIAADHCSRVQTFVQPDRVAVSLGFEFEMWELTSGKLLGTVTPPATHMSGDISFSHNHMEGLGPVAANRSGSKLAFLPAGSKTLLMYNALTLELLGCVAPSGPDSTPFLDNEVVTGLTWNVWSMLATSCTVEGGHRHTSEFKLGPGCNSYRVQSSAVPPGAVLASSPDGAFACNWEFESSTIRVYDTRTGQLKSAYVVNKLRELPGSTATCVYNLRQGAWSTCGSWLVLTARMALTELPYGQMEYVLFMRIL